MTCFDLVFADIDTVIDCRVDCIGCPKTCKNDKRSTAMAERCLLHKNKVELLKWWLSSKGYEIQQNKGIYEVLRAKKGKDTVVIFKKSDATEHLTVQQKDHRLIRQFINETKEYKGNDRK